MSTAVLSSSTVTISLICNIVLSVSVLLIQPPLFSSHVLETSRQPVNERYFTFHMSSALSLLLPSVILSSFIIIREDMKLLSGWYTVKRTARPIGGVDEFSPGFVAKEPATSRAAISYHQSTASYTTSATSTPLSAEKMR